MHGTAEYAQGQLRELETEVEERHSRQGDWRGWTAKREKEADTEVSGRGGEACSMEVDREGAAETEEQDRGRGQAEGYRTTPGEPSSGEVA